MIAALRGRLSAVHDNHKRIASGALTIGLLTLAAKVFVAAREMSIAWRYGVSATVDAYQLSITITTWLPMLLTSAMTAVLVPKLVSIQPQSPERSFVDELNGNLVALGLGVTALIFIAAPAAATLLASKSNPETLALAKSMSRQMAPMAFFMLASGYLSARLQSRERFAYSATEAVPALVIVLAVTVSWGAGGALPLIGGTVVGYFLQVLLLGFLCSRGDASLGTIRLRHRSPKWNMLYAGILAMVLGQLALSLAMPVDQAFASRLGSGTVATLGYATRIVSLLTGAGAIVLARALLPVLSAAAASDNPTLGARQAQQWALTLFLFGLFTASVGWFLADWGVALLFQRGAFSASDTAAVAHALRPALLQLPFYFGGLALVQWIAATGRYHVLLWVACLAIAVKIVANLILVQMFGLAGIMASTAIMYAVSAAAQSLYIWKAK